MPYRRGIASVYRERMSCAGFLREAVARFNNWSIMSMAGWQASGLSGTCVKKQSSVYWERLILVCQFWKAFILRDVWLICGMVRRKL